MRTPTNIAEPGKRLLAALIDGIILGTVYSIILGITLIPFIRKISQINEGQFPMDDAESASMVMGSLGIIFLGFTLYYVGVFLYYTLQHSGKHQATIGKRAMKLYVTDEHGERLTFGKAAIRFLGRIINSFTMYIGYLIILFTEKKQGLHDIIAKTLVLDGTKQNTPNDFDEL